MRHLSVIISALGLATGALLTSPAGAETFDRTAKANTRTAIGGFAGYEVDTCYSSVVPDVTVRRAPDNGSIVVLPQEQVLPKESRCPGRKVRGLVYVYTPKKGFKGVDEVSLDFPWRSTDSGQQMIWTHTFRIKVE